MVTQVVRKNCTVYVGGANEGVLEGKWEVSMTVDQRKENQDLIGIVVVFLMTGNQRPEL